jgi:hypothetical protein
MGAIYSMHGGERRNPGNFKGRLFNNWEDNMSMDINAKKS